MSSLRRAHRTHEHSQHFQRGAFRRAAATLFTSCYRLVSFLSILCMNHRIGARKPPSAVLSSHPSNVGLNSQTTEGWLKVRSDNYYYYSLFLLLFRLLLLLLLLLSLPLFMLCISIATICYYYRHYYKSEEVAPRRYS